MAVREPSTCAYDIELELPAAECVKAGVAYDVTAGGAVPLAISRGVFTGTSSGDPGGIVDYLKEGVCSLQWSG